MFGVGPTSLGWGVGLVKQYYMIQYCATATVDMEFFVRVFHNTPLYVCTVYT